jgi:hypothetical protein
MRVRYLGQADAVVGERSGQRSDDAARASRNQTTQSKEFDINWPKSELGGEGGEVRTSFLRHFLLSLLQLFAL